MRLTVCGRAGAGRRTVTEALRAAGAIAGPPARNAQAGELALYVFVEAATDEDRDALASLVGAERPCLAVLNKADLSGFRGGNPMAVARTRCRALTRETGVPAAPLAALAARAGYRGLDDLILVGLRMLVGGPARLDPDLRDALLAELDYYGLAHAVAALRAGATADGVAAALREASGMGAVLAAAEHAAAAARYRGLSSAPALLMARDGDCRAADAMVAVRAAAAADVMRAAGLRVAGLDPTEPPAPGAARGETAAACLRAAVLWQRYARGPVDELHRDCARELSRTWLRRWAGR